MPKIADNYPLPDETASVEGEHSDHKITDLGDDKTERIKTLVADALEIDISGVQRFLVTAEGKCPDCGGDHSYTIATNLLSDGEFIEFITSIVHSRIVMRGRSPK